MTKTAHWTAKTIEDYRFSVAFDFVEQVQEAMESNDKAKSQKDLADLLAVSEGRVSQVFNNPGNLTLRSMIEWGQALGRKLGVVLYDDDDEHNMLGPVEAEVFTRCWEAQGRPRNRGDLQLKGVYSLRVVQKSAGNQKSMLQNPMWTSDALSSRPEIHEPLFAMVG